MKIFRTIEDIPSNFTNPVVTIGNFDGVHLGHREILRSVKTAAERLGGVSVVVTFFPHPLKVLAPERNFKLITSYDQKEALIASSDIDYLISIPFTREFAAISPAQFVQDILVRRIGARKVIIGYDYAFGRNREGNIELLRELGAELGFEVEMLDQVGNTETAYSSSTIRALIEDGDVKRAVPLLGRFFSVGGEVVHGLHRGKDLGFPTANIDPEEELLPRAGVYAVKVDIAGATFDGACNIGFNPTFKGGRLTIEVHVLDVDRDLYGARLRVYFVDRVRDERPFSNANDLRKAITKDIVTCRKILAGVSLDNPGGREIFDQKVAVEYTAVDRHRN